MVELKKVDNRVEWDNFVSRQGQASLLQSWSWREFLEAEGRTPQSFFVLKNSQTVAAVLVGKIVLPGGRYYLYSPRGPIFQDGLSNGERQDICQFLALAIGQESLFKKAIFWRIDPTLTIQELNLYQAGFVKANKESQPAQTRILDIGLPEQDLLINMKPRTRYNVRQAERRGVTVLEAANERHLAQFYDLLKTTGERNGFSIYPKRYFEHLWQALRPEHLRIYLAEYEGKIIAGTVIGYYGPTMAYLHSASDYGTRVLHAPYLLKWHAIREGRKNGKTRCDLWGVAPPAASENHPWAGITKFKEGFGGRYEEYVGAYDYVYRPGWYRLFNVARNIKRKFR